MQSNGLLPEFMVGAACRAGDAHSVMVSPLLARIFHIVYRSSKRLRRIEEKRDVVIRPIGFIHIILK